MVDEQSRCALVLNGEVYNHEAVRRDLAALGVRFRGSSDTEVLLSAFKLWGIECLERIEGMFAFAVFDEPRRKLYLVRDRVGEKPLFYRVQGRSLSFASELKCLIPEDGAGVALSLPGVTDYLTRGYTASPETILHGVHKVPPAHYLEFDLQACSVQLKRYWNLPSPTDGQVRECAADLAARLRATLGDAVQRQMQADVPVGLLLSGGLDSSLITALASERCSRVKTYTVTFQGHSGFDESCYARLVSTHFGTEHHELAIGSDLGTLIPKLVEHCDEPIMDSSLIPSALVSQLVRQHCTVALGGDGGDELFGGYPYYSRLRRLEVSSHLVPYPVRARLLRAFASHSRSESWKRWARIGALRLDRDLPLVLTKFDHADVTRLLQVQPPAVESEYPIIAGYGSPGSPLIQRAMAYDFSRYLPEDLLVKVDRASMMSSLEQRSPFLDRKVVEFAFGAVPSSLKVTARSQKILLKQLGRQLLPQTLDLNRKQGFTIPLAALMARGPLRELCQDSLFDPQCMFDRAAVQRLFDALDTRATGAERLFGLAMFEMWRFRFKVPSLTGASVQ